MARLPETIEGQPVVNAGIGDTLIAEFVSFAPKLLEGVKPSLCVVALGANDVGSGSARTDYAALLVRLKTLCPDVLAVALTPMDGAGAINIQIKTAASSQGVRFIDVHVPEADRLPDRIHLNTAGSRIWTAGLVAAIETLHG
jgi:lysophospholipase L1-like esterase